MRSVNGAKQQIAVYLLGRPQFDVVEVCYRYLEVLQYLNTVIRLSMYIVYVTRAN
jgi:hypothetical protein